MGRGFCLLSLLAGASLISMPTARALPVTEQIDRFELNWSTMRIRFYGEATVDFAQKGFEGAEKVATDEGLMYVLSSLNKVRNQKGLKDNSNSAIAHEVTKQAFVYNTVYFTDGRIRVELDSSLPKAFDAGLSDFLAEEPQSQATGDASAVILQITGLKGPLLQTEIRSTDGELLYSHKNIAKSAYKKQLAGRWFFKNSLELKSYAGTNPVMIDAVAEGDKGLVVMKDQWNKLKAEHPRLLEEAKLAFVIPGPAKGSSKGNM